MTHKSNAKQQKISDPKFVPYVTLKAPKEAIISTPAPSSSSTLTSVLTNLDLEIVQEVFDTSKLLDPNMEEDLKDFTVVTKATPFAAATHIKFTPKEKNNSKIILAINNTAAALHVIIPDLKIDIFCDFSQYKADMQFNEKTIHVTDITLQMKPANIKQVFAKYGSITNFKMTVRGMWQHAYITYKNPKCIELCH
ncbi:17978_t:CDS:2 [Funneliformis geosporum]|uniref:17978_t:CDS:1 n=1 Tax=Funneliformis geosporum TaxID=1117311 RepID=A0A9W4SLP8_9GLOM|nr:17978_t:CDS:2 [Funneliformis geosporum]